MNDMSDETTPPASFDFERAFREFLEQSVGKLEPEKPPFVARLAEHLGKDPGGLPIVERRFSAIEHPNIQAALDA